MHQHGCASHGGRVGDALALVTSELVTNAVLYGAAPIRLQLVCRTHEVRLAVTDAGGMLPDQPRTPGGLGQGLRIVEELSTSWGALPLVTGKEVWCLIATGTPPRGQHLSLVPPL